MSKQSGTVIITVLAIAFFAALIPGSSAQVRLEVTGSIEFPSLKCVMRPQQYEIDVENKTICFCVWIYNTVPTWNCVRPDGKASLEDVEYLMDTIRNLTTFGGSIGGAIGAGSGTITLPGAKSNTDEREVEKSGLWAGKKPISKIPVADRFVGMAPKNP